jgi:two-component system sensor histidine kinase VicK
MLEKGACPEPGRSAASAVLPVSAATIVSSIAEGVVITDPAGRILSVNPAMEGLLGWGEEEVRGQLVLDVYKLFDDRGGEIPIDERPLARALAERRVEGTHGYRLMILTRDGRRLPVAVTAAPIFDQQNEVLGGVAIVRDVSYERELDELKSALISTVSHELRTPLTMIQGFSELLLTRQVGQEKGRQALQQIHESARRLSRLIGDLLEVSRIDAGRLEAHPTSLELADVVAEVTDQFAQQREVRVEVDGTCSVLADRDKLLQILTNLVSNAVKYSQAPVSVTARNRGDHVEVSVEDRGIGMTEDELGQLFQKFFRARRADVREAGGTGLGLFISKNLVELHGGEIRVESEPEKGTTFTFTLPAAPEANEGSAGEGSTESLARKRRAGVVLEERT